eukprot:CAMPEP_0201897250 /NCGR_PEP_ID=MMETSP0902-20130614/46204_1 /ASSEMBLY_ACC=CAM_ASM_000551 /TAXON_ID=420261 /ORGANISM="Thalassiosira antarctica, Strain CCMP982" /LENGTH=73 /DNA_ID=CAMNT_0048430063 /DNA_START=26 /DNA_END=244 /DNA_ORIENTATION=+
MAGSTNFTTTGFPGRMKVSMVFLDEAKKFTEETNLSTLTQTGSSTTSGRYFHGNLHIVSQLMFLVFKVHLRWF